jgi:hypothetical protein
MYLVGWILCRGVLNDVDYLDFILILKNFYRALKQNGVLLLDVREWNNSLVKYTQTPVFSKEFIYQHSACKFTSLTIVNKLDNSLDIKEKHLIGRKSTKTKSITIVKPKRVNSYFSQNTQILTEFFKYII